MSGARLAIVALVFLSGLLAPIYSLAQEKSSFCARWKGRTFISSPIGETSSCIGPCQVELVDEQGATARWEVTGAKCAKKKAPAKVEPPASPVEAPKPAVQVVPVDPCDVIRGRYDSNGLPCIAGCQVAIFPPGTVPPGVRLGRFTGRSCTPG